jgi:DNA replication protein DnaC
MEELIYKLKSIRLSGITQQLDIRLQEATSHELSYLDFLKNLVEDEITLRKDRLLNRRFKQAAFPLVKTLDDFDFSFNPTINKQLIKKLAAAAFVAQLENILFIGPPGVGKTHLAVAFGMEAIHKGFSVLYRSTFDITTDIHKYQNDVMAVYLKPQLLIIDELGMKNLSMDANELLLEIIHRRYQRASTIIATNRPIEDWGKIFGDNATASAILDRFLENVHFIKITGKSYRLKNLNTKEQKIVDSQSKNP